MQSLVDEVMNTDTDTETLEHLSRNANAIQLLVDEQSFVGIYSRLMIELKT